MINRCVFGSHTCWQSSSRTTEWIGGKVENPQSGAKKAVRLNRTHIVYRLFRLPILLCQNTYVIPHRSPFSKQFACGNWLQLHRKPEARWTHTCFVSTNDLRTSARQFRCCSCAKRPRQCGEQRSPGCAYLDAPSLGSRWNWARNGSRRLRQWSRVAPRSLLSYESRPQLAGMPDTNKWNGICKRKHLRSQQHWPQCHNNFLCFTVDNWS